MSSTTTVALPLALGAFCVKAGQWVMTQGDLIVNQGIRQSNALIAHVCHGCDINRFAPDLNKVNKIIDQWPFYTEQAASGFKAILAESIETEKTGEGISTMGAICVAAGVALGLYAAYNLTCRAVNYLRS